MQKNPEPLVTISANITESQVEKVKFMMTGRSKNKSQIIRDAIDHEWQRHCQEVNGQLPIDSEAQ